MSPSPARQAPPTRSARKGPLQAPALDSLGLGLAARDVDGQDASGARRRDAAWRLRRLCVRSVARKGYAVRALGNGGSAARGLLRRVRAANARLSCNRLSRTSSSAKASRALSGNVIPQASRSSRGLGDEHVRTGKPIFYTSVDSVIQIAAHEEAFGLATSLRLCKIDETLRGPAEHRTRDRASVSWKRRVRLQAHAEPEGFLDAPAAGQYSRSASTRLAGTSSPLASAATSSAIEAPARKSRAQTTSIFSRECFPLRRGFADGGSVVRQFRRPRHRLRTSSQRGGIRRGHRAPRSSDRIVPRSSAAKATSASSPPTMATIRHGRALTTRARTCRSSPMSPAGRSRDIGRRSTFADIGASVARHLGVAAPDGGAAWN